MKIGIFNLPEGQMLTVLIKKNKQTNKQKDPHIVLSQSFIILFIGEI